MTKRKIYALCKKLGLSTTYYENWGHGFYNEVEAETDELEDRVMRTVRDKQLIWYEKELSRCVKKDTLHLCPDIFQHDGILVCNGGTKENAWEGCTQYIRLRPLEELWHMYKEEVEKGPHMPDFKNLERQCKRLAREHWKNKDKLPVIQLVGTEEIIG